MKSHSEVALQHGCVVAVRTPPFGRVLALAMIAIIVVFAARPQPAAAQNPIEIRFQSPTRGEIVARYADGAISTQGASDMNSGKWWTGSYTAKLADLDLENVEYGKFTAEAGSPAAATLSCKANSNCVSKKGKWTQIKCDADLCNKDVPASGTDRSVDIWCESVSKCQEFVKTLKDTLAKAAQ
jgi:hypothetical protein